MKPLAAVLVLAGVLAVTASAQPAINANGIVNAGSYAIPGLPNSGIAQGSIFTIFGTNMGPATLQKASSFPIPSNLGGTSVKITAGGQSFDAPMIYTVAGQVAAIMPSNTPVGSANVTVTYNGATSASQSVQVVANSFGTFSVNQQGNGAGVIVDSNYQLFLPNSAARPGDAAILWGTGLGPVTFPDSGQPQATNLTNIPVQLYVGGKTVNTTYQGRSGCCAGLDQIIFTVPSGVEGCSVPVTVRINNVVSNTTTMPITSSSNRVCSDPGGISDTDLAGLFSKGTFSVGFVELTRTTSTSSLPPPIGGTTTTDSGFASFSSFTPTSYAGATGALQFTAVGSCIVTVFSGQGSSPVSGTSVGLDAGSAISVTGPKGAKQLTPLQAVKGAYSAQLSSTGSTYLDPGSYAINNGSGGADVKGFSFNLNVAQALTWTNQSTVTANPIDRTKGVTVTWSGGAPGTYATISGTSIVTGPPAFGAGFVCRAPVEAGTFTVGPDVLLQLPPSTTISAGGFSISTGSLDLANASNPVKFTAPGLDYGFATASSGSGATVAYQ